MKNLNGSNKLPKLLVIGSTFPGSNDGGGIVRDEILRQYPKERYICASTNPADKEKSRQNHSESITNVHCLVSPLVPQINFYGARFSTPIFRAIGFCLVAPFSASRIIKFGKLHKVEMVWTELYGDSVIIAEKVAQKLGVPFIATVWDDPEAWFQDGGYDLFSRWLLRQRFREALKNARFLSTAGEAMQREYKQKYGVESVILRHGFKLPIIPKNESPVRDEIHIGFIGNAYSRNNWSAFLSAVALLNRKGILPDIKLRIFGRVNLHDVPDDVKIENNGWQPAEKALKGIAETDFCYLEHWFDPHKRRHAELSFPNKFETYMAAGRPVFFHGPEYAGVAETISKYRVGICVHTLVVDEIAAALEEMIVNTTLRKQFEKAAIDAFHKEFNADVMVKNFYTMIGIDFASTLHQKGMNDKQRSVRI